METLKIIFLRYRINTRSFLSYRLINGKMIKNLILIFDHPISLPDHFRHKKLMEQLLSVMFKKEGWNLNNENTFINFQPETLCGVKIIVKDVKTKNRN